MSRRSITVTFGATVPMTIDLYNDDGQLTDPTDLTLIVQDSAGINASYEMNELTRTTQGLWEKVINFNLSGRWDLRWEATGAVENIVEQPVYVEPSRVV